MQQYALGLHGGSQSEPQSEPVAGVEDLGGGIGATLKHAAIEQRREGVVGVALVVAYPRLVAGAHRVARHRHPHGVYQEFGCHHRVGVYVSVYALYRRTVYVDQQPCGLVALPLEEAREGVVAPAAEEDARLGQLLAQAHLVDVSLTGLALHLLAYQFDMMQQHVVVATRVGIESEVAAADERMGGVAGGEHVEVYVFGAEGMVSGVDAYLAHVAQDAEMVFEIGVDVDVGAYAQVEGIVGDAQTVQVGLVEVAGKGATDAAAVGDAGKRQLAVEEGIVAGGVEVDVASRHVDGGVGVADALSSHVYLAQLGARLQSGARTEHVDTRAPCRQRAGEGAYAR